MEGEIVDQLRFLSVPELQILSWLISIKLRKVHLPAITQLFGLLFSQSYTHVLIFLYSMRELSCFCSKPGPTYEELIKHILHYSSNTRVSFKI